MFYLWIEWQKNLNLLDDIDNSLKLNDLTNDILIYSFPTIINFMFMGIETDNYYTTKRILENA